MCFSGCQDCLAVQCKQIPALILFSQYLPSPVIKLKVLAFTVCGRAAIQMPCDADTGVKPVERTVRTVLYCTCEFLMGEVD